MWNWVKGGREVYRSTAGGRSVVGLLWRFVGLRGCGGGGGGVIS